MRLSRTEKMFLVRIKFNEVGIYLIFLSFVHGCTLGL